MSAVGPLATADDLAARIGELTAAQAARAEALLDDASALIRDFKGQTLSFVEDDEITVRLQGLRARLPERPVGAVASVSTVDGTELPTTAWSWDGLDMVTVADGYAEAVLKIVYSHGWETLPTKYVTVCCNMVNRVLTAPSLAEGLTGEQIGAYGYQTTQQVGTGGTGVRLTNADKEQLGRPKSGTVMVRPW